ncbi:MAG: hypothetical protein IT559_03795 [Alphaproteobacteria bacterium]|nr:hypothetical protein [Alphaproteobacteria bacterium]
MIYAIGVLGFIGGFAAGQMLLYFLLRHKSREDLLTDRHLKLKYGLLNWGFAVLGCYAFMEIYQKYFG